MAAQNQVGNDCGFQCPNCGLGRVIVDDRLLTLIYAMQTSEVFPVCCPECGTQHEFTREDLRVFDRRKATDLRRRISFKQLCAILTLLCRTTERQLLSPADQNDEEDLGIAYQSARDRTRAAGTLPG